MCYSTFKLVIFREGDGSMSDFMVRMNTYYNGLNQGYGRTTMPGAGEQEPKEAEQAGKMPGEGNIQQDAELPKGRKAQKEEKPKDGFREKEPGEECQTCKNRKYKDGSDENVSFKAAAHISPEAAASRVRAHEGEHVANAYSKAEQQGGEVVSASVRIEMSVCPECGKSYVSGGTTTTKIRYPADSGTGESQTDSQEQENSYGVNQDKGNSYAARQNPYATNRRQLFANAVRGNGFDHATRPMEEFETERY